MCLEARSPWRILGRQGFELCLQGNKTSSQMVRQRQTEMFVLQDWRSETHQQLSGREHRGVRTEDACDTESELTLVAARQASECKR